MAAITVGNACTDRADSLGAGYTRVDGCNPADGTGNITSIKVYPAQNMSNFDAGVFTDNGGNNLTCTKAAAMTESPTAGSCNQYTSAGSDFTAFAVASGQYAGCYFSAGNLDVDTSGAGAWYKFGDKCADDITYDYEGFNEDRTISLLLEGETGVGDLSISVNDSIASLESTIPDHPLAGISKEELIVILEAIIGALSTLSSISEYELTAVMESITTQVSSPDCEVSDIASLQEVISSAMSGLLGDKYDILAIQEYTNIIVSSVAVIIISKYDNIVLQETIINQVSDLSGQIHDYLAIQETISGKTSNLAGQSVGRIAIQEVISSAISTLLPESHKYIAIQENLDVQFSGYNADVLNNIGVQEYIRLIVATIGAYGYRGLPIQFYVQEVLRNYDK